MEATARKEPPMSALAMPNPILDVLASRPSRASAAAIGIHYVLNGVPPALRVRGVDALSKMVCDWSVAILEEAITEPNRGYLVRRHALMKLRQLVETAIARGYAGISRRDCARLASECLAILGQDGGSNRAKQALEDLCNHLSQAVADGHFGRLADF